MTIMRKMIAEFIGTFTLVFLGVGAAVIGTVLNGFDVNKSYGYRYKYAYRYGSDYAYGSDQA